MQKSVRIITDSRTARVLVDPMRREIVRLLAEDERTENELAEDMGLSNPSVGHHLKVLRHAGLIRVARTEAEEHGILQKFYASNAIVYLVDSHEMSKEIDRYFMPISLERVRGIMAAAGLVVGSATELTEADVENFAKLFVAALVEATKRFSKSWKGTREELLAALYTAALRYVLKDAETPAKVRELLQRALLKKTHNPHNPSQRRSRL